MLGEAASVVKILPTMEHEHQLLAAGFDVVAGADEAGRGCCAGPIVAAACILADEIPGLADSKLLSEKARVSLAEQIMAKAKSVSWVRIEASEIDQIGIQQANYQALRMALLGLDPTPDFALIDGYNVSGLPFESKRLIKGDQVSCSVAAASIIAKVNRDQIMADYDLIYPGYGFAKHKGYGTKAHQEALVKYGPCDIHRMSYANVARAVSEAGRPSS